MKFAFHFLYHNGKPKPPPSTVFLCATRWPQLIPVYLNCHCRMYSHLQCFPRSCCADTVSPNKTVLLLKSTFSYILTMSLQLAIPLIFGPCTSVVYIPKGDSVYTIVPCLYRAGVLYRFSVSPSVTLVVEYFGYCLFAVHSNYGEQSNPVFGMLLSLNELSVAPLSLNILTRIALDFCGLCHEALSTSRLVVLKFACGKRRKSPVTSCGWGNQNRRAGLMATCQTCFESSEECEPVELHQGCHRAQ